MIVSEKTLMNLVGLENDDLLDALEELSEDEKKLIENYKDILSFYENALKNKAYIVVSIY